MKKAKMTDIFCSSNAQIKYAWRKSVLIIKNKYYCHKLLVAVIQKQR